VVRNTQAREGRNFEIIYKKHLQPFINNNSNSKFAQHFLEKGHTFGKMMDISEIMYFTAKGMYMSTMEFFLIQIKKLRREINLMTKISCRFLQVISHKECQSISSAASTPQ
jgi:hypothetical protein